MKKIILLIVLFTSFLSFSQNSSLTGVIIFLEDNLPFPGTNVELLKNGESFLKTQTDIDGKFTFKNIPNGIYDLRFSYFRAREKIINNIEIISDLDMSQIIFPNPCPKVEKVCPKNHKDNLIPIKYGFPSEKMLKEAEKGKIKLGGCDPSFCEKWHCKIHEIDF